MEAYICEQMNAVKTESELVEVIDRTAFVYAKSVAEVKTFLSRPEHHGKWKVCTCKTCTGLKHWGEICAKCGDDLAQEQRQPKSDNNMILCYPCEKVEMAR